MDRMKPFYRNWTTSKVILPLTQTKTSKCRIQWISSMFNLLQLRLLLFVLRQCLTCNSLNPLYRFTIHITSMSWLILAVTANLTTWSAPTNFAKMSIAVKTWSLKKKRWSICKHKSTMQWKYWPRFQSIQTFISLKWNNTSRFRMREPKLRSTYKSKGLIGWARILKCKIERSKEDTSMMTGWKSKKETFSPKKSQILPLVEATHLWPIDLT